MTVSFIKKSRRLFLAAILCAAFFLTGLNVHADCPVATKRYRIHHQTRYLGVEKMDGIDVSEHQGVIDWAKVKKAGIDFAFIRIGGRGYGSAGNMYNDDMCTDNVRGAIANGIQVGLYFYSQALTVEEAKAEARQVLYYMNPPKGTELYDRMKGGFMDLKDKITLPIVMDYEYSPVSSGRFVSGRISKAQATRNAEAFIGEIRAAGFDACVYGSANFLENQLDCDRLSLTSSIWLAHYTDYTDYEGEYTWWQYTDTGYIDGIPENVDMNVWYKKDKIDTEYHCVKTTYNGETGWYCVRDGKVVPDFTGFVENEYGWWYIENGRVDFEHTGLYKGTIGNTEDWWNVKNSRVEFVNTIAENKYGWWYVINGSVDFEVTGVYKGVVNGEYGWWNIRNGHVILEESTLAKNEYGWWYCKDGKVDFEYNGIQKNKYGYWYCKDGKVDFDHDSIEKNSNGWWKITGGMVNFNYTGIAKNAYGWWRVVNGKVDFNFTGLAKNEYGWWYCRNGKVDFAYSGLAENQYGKWLVRNGMVRFGYSGYYIIDGHEYYLVNGRVVEEY